MRTRAQELQAIADRYVADQIDAFELEAEIERVLAPGWHPMSRLDAVLKETYARR